MHWRGVLAGAFANDKAMARAVYHLASDEDYAPLCKRVKPERMCDEPVENPASKCPRCIELAVKRGI